VPFYDIIVALPSAGIVIGRWKEGGRGANFFSGSPATRPIMVRLNSAEVEIM
jgi:hypothetical protein